MTGKARDRAITAIGVFLVFGAAMASLAGASLTWPGTPLDRMWSLNPRAYRDLSPHATLAGIAFLLLGCTLAATSVGWLQRRRWGWWLAVALIATQLAGDAGNMVFGRVAEGLLGVVIAGALLLYMTHSRVRGEFL